MGEVKLNVVPGCTLDDLIQVMNVIGKAFPDSAMRNETGTAMQFVVEVPPRGKRKQPKGKP
jgi:hypothetical protein